MGHYSPAVSGQYSHDEHGLIVPLEIVLCRGDEYAFSIVSGVSVAPAQTSCSRVPDRLGRVEMTIANCTIRCSTSFLPARISSIWKHMREHACAWSSVERRSNLRDGQVTEVWC